MTRHSGRLLSFEAWGESIAPKLLRRGCKVEFERSTDVSKEALSAMDKLSAHMDAFNERCALRITLWNTGECDIEVLDHNTGSPIFFENHVFQDPESMLTMIDGVCERFLNIRSA